MGIKEDIKMLIVKKGTTMTKVAQLLSIKTNKQYTVQSLSKKLAANTLRLSEAHEIADILGFDIEFIERKD